MDDRTATLPGDQPLRSARTEGLRAGGRPVPEHTGRLASRGNEVREERFRPDAARS